MSNLNTVDYVILVLLALGGISGAIKGFLEELSQKFGLLLGLIASLMFTQSLTPVVIDKLGLPLWVSTGISFVVIFLVGYLIMKILGSILQAIFKSSDLSFIDNLLGFLLGVFEMVVFIGLIVSLFKYQSFVNLDKYVNESLLYSRYIGPFFNQIVSLLQKVF